MKSIPLLLYLVSAGLFGLAGWTVYQMLPLWKEKVRYEATKGGADAANKWIPIGKGQGPVGSDWRYDQAT